MKTISDYNEWEPFGKGAYGTTYRNKENPSIMLKMDKRCDEDVVRCEFEVSQKVAHLGISTPEVYEMVTDGQFFGYTAHLIKGKKSICRIISEDPSRMDEMARLFADRSLEFHGTPCDTTAFPSMKQEAAKSIMGNKFLKDETKSAILAELDSIPESGTCLLGDFHFGNLITTGEKQYWIDLGEFKYGNPSFDIARFGFSTLLPSAATKYLYHLTKSQTQEFYLRFLDYYADAQPDKEEFLKRVHAAGLVSRTGVMMNSLLAFLFLPQLQRYRGDKPSCRLSILGKLILGKKLY